LNKNKNIRNIANTFIFKKHIFSSNVKSNLLRTYNSERIVGNKLLDYSFSLTKYRNKQISKKKIQEPNDSIFILKKKKIKLRIKKKKNKKKKIII